MIATWVRVVRVDLIYISLGSVNNFYNEGYSTICGNCFGGYLDVKMKNENEITYPFLNFNGCTVEV